MKVVQILAIGLATSLLLSGCANYSGIATHATLLQPTTLGLSDKADNTFPAQQWWLVFDDAKLNALMLSAINNNPNLKIVQSRMLAAQAMQDQADAIRYPQLSASAQTMRERLSEHSIYPPPLGGSTVTMGTTSLAAQWQIDWFGRERAALDAAIGQTRAAQADSQAAQVLLSASVAQQYFDLAHLQAQLLIKQSLLQQSEHHASLINQRVEAGLDNTLVQHVILADPPQILRELSQLSEKIDLSRHAIATLIGATPNTTAQLMAKLPLNSQVAMPQEIPADLLGHRPDIVASRWRVDSELQGVQVAKAAFYPNINLSAFAGFESLNLSQWINSSSRTLGIGPAISLPIFDAGRLRAQMKGQTLKADVAIETYNATLLNALREVADKLTSGRAIKTQLSEQNIALMQLNHAHELAVSRYKAELSNYITVLISENNLLQQQAIIVDLNARAANETVGLMLALGGGYIPPAIGTQTNLAQESKSYE